MLKSVGKYNADKAKIAENGKTAIDWEHFEDAIDDPVVAEMKKIYETTMKEAETGTIADYEKEQQKLVDTTKAMFEGLVRPALPLSPPSPTAHHALFSVSWRPSISALALACRSSLRAGRRRPRARRGWSRPSRTSRRSRRR